MKLLKLALLGAIGVCSSAQASNEQIPVPQWIHTQIVRMAPPGRTYYLSAKETEEQALERYGSITSDLIRVVYDPNEKPLFSGPRGRAKTAALLLSIANSESGGFRRDVDYGIGENASGDSGESHCLMQVRLSKVLPEEGNSRRKIVLDTPFYSFSTTEGFGASDLVQNRQACFRSALHIIRHSLHSCSRRPLDERLGIYTSGHCDKGIRASKIRMGNALKIFDGGRMETDVSLLDRGVNRALEQHTAML